MENQPPPLNQSSQSSDSPYVSSSQPPMLQQGQAAVGADGLTQDEKTSAMLVHLLGLLTGFIGVLIMWLIKKDSSKFVDYHGREALNFMISVLIYSFVLGGISLVLGIVTMGIGMILVVPLIMAFGIGVLVLEIMACVKANQGEWHRYPLTIRLIPNVN